jgi:hypothetical protein
MTMFSNMTRLPRRALLLVAAVSVGLAASAIALATIPDGNGVIHGCYLLKDGALRVIDDSATSCRSGETPLNWNQTGLQGLTGPQGEQGPPGEPGISGYEIVSEANIPSPIRLQDATAQCPSGKKVLGGGANGERADLGGLIPSPTTIIHASKPTASGTGWYALGDDEQGTSSLAGWTLKVYAVCANVAP